MAMYFLGPRNAARDRCRLATTQAKLRRDFVLLWKPIPRGAARANEPARPRAATNLGRLVVNPLNLFTRILDFGTNIHCLQFRHAARTDKQQMTRHFLGPRNTAHDRSRRAATQARPRPVVVLLWEPIPYLSESLSLEAQHAPTHLVGRGLPQTALAWP